MKDYANVKKKAFEEFEQTGPNRQEKTLREFKDVLQNLIYLLRRAVNADTAYLYWVNRSRQQFVKEAQTTGRKDRRFEDRVAFKNHFLNDYKDIEKPVTIDNSDGNKHAGDRARQGELVLLIPFINNDETVALTVLEWQTADNFNQQKGIETYSATLGKLLNTYLEITDLYEEQQDWVNYDQKLTFLDQSGHPAEFLNDMVQTLQSFLENGSVTLIAGGSGNRCPVLNSQAAEHPAPIGLPAEKQTLTATALQNGSAEFAIHFNENPKRISPREKFTDGATLAVPMTINNFRSAVVLINDKDPLLFKESTKHKLKNIVHLTELKIQSLKSTGNRTNQLLLNKYGAFIPDIWKRTVNTELKRIKEKRNKYTTYIGFATLSNLPQIRTQFRIEDLKCMQQDVIEALKPPAFGTPGIVGFHTDYQYFILLQGGKENMLNQWQHNVDEKFSTPFALSNGKQIKSSVNKGFVKLDDGFEDTYQVIQQCKASLNRSGNNLNRKLRND